MRVTVDQNQVSETHGIIQSQIEGGPRDGMYKDPVSGPLQELGNDAILDSFEKIGETFEIQTGRPFVIFGETGRGKTTIARALYLAVKKALVYNMSPGHNFYKPEWNTDRSIEFENAGLGLGYSKAVTVELADEQMAMYQGPEFIDYPSEVSLNVRRLWQFERMSLAGTGYDSPQDTGFRLRGLSTRQGIDSSASVRERTTPSLEVLVEQFKKVREQDKPIALFLDEPEFGVSPLRHENYPDLVRELSQRVPHLVIATNSVKLWQIRQRGAFDYVELFSAYELEQAELEREAAKAAQAESALDNSQ